MSREEYYLEEAWALRMDEEPHVSLIAQAIDDEMKRKYRREGFFKLRLKGFNYLYFFQATIRLWLTAHPETSLGATSFPYPCHPIRGVNWPSSMGGLGQRQGDIVEQFIHLVEADSTPSGDMFDVLFAVELLTATMDEGWNLRPRSQSPTVLDNIAPDDSVAAFDYWLSGFNALPPKTRDD